jgi:DNA-binding IclR family transcriptional regulator
MDLLSKGDTRITDLAVVLGIDKGSVSRLLQTLANYGYVEKDPETRRYRLAGQVIALSRSLITKMPLRDTAKPYLRELVEKTGECAHLAIFSQGKALYIDQVEPQSPLRVNAEIGTTAPLHCTALGKVLLAFNDIPFPDELPGFTTRTITDSELLRLNLDISRKQGYAIDDEEFDYGVRCLAAPVYDFRGKLIGAMGISGPSSRIPLEGMGHLAEVVVSVAKDLSNRMSFKRPA